MCFTYAQAVFSTGRGLLGQSQCLWCTQSLCSRSVSAAHVAFFSSTFSTRAGFVICVLPPKLSSFLGPTDEIPFGDVVQYTAVVGVFVWARWFVNQTGFVHTHCPAEPRTSYVPQILNSVTVTVSILDCFTDMAFFRVLLHKVCTPHVLLCMFFTNYLDPYALALARISWRSHLDFVLVDLRSLPALHVWASDCSNVPKRHSGVGRERMLSLYQNTCRK